MATRAVILTRDPGTNEGRIGRILEFFGIRSVSLNVESRATLETEDATRDVVIASVDAFAAAMARPDAARFMSNTAAVYLYATADRIASERALQRLEGWAGASLASLGSRECRLSVSPDLGQLDGPMSGITVSARLQSGDFVLTGLVSGVTLLRADNAPAFVRLDQQGVPTFFCTSAEMVDIDRPVTGIFFDIKDHFVSLVPLVVFLRWAFRDSMWRPFEAGACLIVDDPLLKATYGFCDFKTLLEVMNRYDFTTNVAFIPWNWRRTSASASEFFRREGRRFSVSVHGCDHTASEFGDTSVDGLDGKVRLAQLRMREHEARTGIAHEPVMVFPQGVFSSRAPGVLKRHGFIAAVNTEVNPVDLAAGPTRIRDVWDVAITRYGGFPIFTRRYSFHGLENFAFDLLVGKPCLIASHHGFFKQGCAEAVDLIRKLDSLKGQLTWRSLSGVIRRAGRRRPLGPGREEIDMPVNELSVTNRSTDYLDVVIRKRESDASSVASVRSEGGVLDWDAQGEQVVFADRIPPTREALFSVAYKPQPPRPQTSRPIRFAATVAARRILSEFRDEYWQRYVRG